MKRIKRARRNPGISLALVPPQDLQPDEKVHGLLDLTGKSYGSLQVTGRAVNRGKKVYWICVCICGTPCEKNSYELRKSSHPSCGCVVNAGRAARATTHGMRHTGIYYSWKNMMNRCYREGTIGYQYWGGRGIRVANAWHSFDTFLQDMRSTWVEGLTLDREEVDGDYCKDNCRWVTKKVQANNRRNSRLVNFRGRKYTLSQLADKQGIPYKRLHDRLRSGMSFKRALTEGVLK